MYTNADSTYAPTVFQYTFTGENLTGQAAFLFPPSRESCILGLWGGGYVGKFAHQPRTIFHPADGMILRGAPAVQTDG
jgi:hypothetical protein